MPFTLRQKRTPRIEYPIISVQGMAVAAPIKIPIMILTNGPPANAPVKFMV
jgi:hypothetical protein